MRSLAPFLFLAALLSHCSSSSVDDTIKVAEGLTISATVSGLNGTLVVQNNGEVSATISADGSFVIASGIATGATYDVTIAEQPNNQTCTVSGGQGTVGTSAVAAIAIVCADGAALNYTVGGTVSGLSGTVVLQNNGGDDLTIGSDGAFTFATALSDGGIL